MLCRATLRNKKNNKLTSFAERDFPKLSPFVKEDIEIAYRWFKKNNQASNVIGVFNTN